LQEQPSTLAPLVCARRAIRLLKLGRQPAHPPVARLKQLDESLDLALLRRDHWTKGDEEKQSEEKSKAHRPKAQRQMSKAQSMMSKVRTII
jgi:hypothetical protein